MVYPLFGEFPFGAELGPFGGPGLITVLGILPTSTRSFTLVFDRDVKTGDAAAFDSVDNPNNFTLSAIDPRVLSGGGGGGYLPVPRGFRVPTRFPSVVRGDRVKGAETQVELFTDCLLEAGVDYSVVISSQISGAGDEMFAGIATWEFRAPKFSGAVTPIAQREETYRDIAYSIDVDEKFTFVHDANGDLAIHGGLDSLKKRIIRRVTTSKGAFAFLPNYGLAPRLKVLMRPGLLQEYASEVANQVREEPDVLDAATSVKLVDGRPGMVDVKIRARRRSGEVFDVGMVVPLTG